MATSAGSSLSLRVDLGNSLVLWLRVVDLTDLLVRKLLAVVIS